MPHAPTLTPNSSLSAASPAGVVILDTPIIFALEIMGSGAGREVFGDEVSELLADDRMSGTAAGTIILHIAPEVAISGPLALVQTSDRICLDAAGRRLELLVSDEEIARRKSGLQLPRMSPNRGYGKLFHDHAAQSHALEVGCQQFDVCQDQQNSNTIFLYEIYDDEAAFETHKAAPHYDEFNLAINGMVVKKSIRFLQNIGHHS